MTGFVASPSPPPAPIADAIAGDGWWPALSIAAFREAVRVPASAASDARVREALIGAALTVADALASWRTAQQATGAQSLAQLGPAVVGGEPRALILWRRAVYATAAADLVETHGDIAATDQGAKANAEERLHAGTQRRAATVAIRDILGRPRTRSALL
ncbi:MAG: hypothetical protein A4S12_07085 [Proteobacteria bacterium SG_bin5]|nr:head completion/stabilization protein [Sphingomonas sp.]OQW42096.1 MAG: hypothetical protein A4S12_07085 [Proteobacteria bacterium SG_bin5]